VVGYFLKFPLAFQANFSRRVHILFQLFYFPLEVGDILLVHISRFLSSFAVLGLLNPCLLLTSQSGCIDGFQIDEISFDGLSFIFSDHAFLVQLLLAATVDFFRG
jgi:hypothetical protein